jgi:hypothetical protein
LIKRGALRSLRDAKGRIPFDIAYEQGHSHLFQRLKPPKPPLHPDRLHELDQRLAHVIYGRCAELFTDDELSFAEALDYWRRMVRYPPVEILPEFRKQQVWFPIPSKTGGFRITLLQGFLEVISWNGAKKGSGLAEIITDDDIIFADHGFI